MAHRASWAAAVRSDATRPDDATAALQPAPVASSLIACERDRAAGQGGGARA